MFVGLALLAYALTDSPTVWRAFGRAALWGSAAGVVGLRFVPPVVDRFTPLGLALGVVALVLLAVAQSVVWGVAGAVTHLARTRASAPLPLAFGAGVFVAMLVPLVFAWTPAGLVSPWPALVQLGDLIGERGVSVLFAVVAGLVASAATLRRAAPRRSAASLLAAAGVLAALVVHGTLRMRTIQSSDASLPRLRVGLVDQAVGPLDRWKAENHAPILRGLRALTRAVEAEGVDLTVWPEAAYPYRVGHGDRRAPTRKRAVTGDGVTGPVLMGLITFAKPQVTGGEVTQDSYNSATIVLSDGTMLEPYDKLQLLWFGETVPGGAYLPWLRRVFEKSGGLLPGDEPRALVLPRAGAAVRIGVLNCYEDTLAGVGRMVASVSPDLLVNVTNDAWFVGTSEPELHARLAVMRAVELRRDLVRAVNLGVTSWVDAAGVVRLREERGSPSFAIASPALRSGPPTFYARFGDWTMATLIALGLIVWAMRAPNHPPPPNGGRGSRSRL